MQHGTDRKYCGRLGKGYRLWLFESVVDIRKGKEWLIDAQDRQFGSPDVPCFCCLRRSPEPCLWVGIDRIQKLDSVNRQFRIGRDLKHRNAIVGGQHRVSTRVSLET